MLCVPFNSAGWSPTEHPPWFFFIYFLYAGLKLCLIDIGEHAKPGEAAKQPF